MLIAGQIFGLLAAALHVLFFVFESILWARPSVHRRFGVKSPEQAEALQVMAYNQGFYNLALAVGVFVGVALVGGEHEAVGRTLIIFGTGCMVVAGAVLLSSGRSYLRAAAVQFVPPALALVLVTLG